VGYTLPGILTLCVAGLLGRNCLEAEWRPRPLLQVAAALLAFAITGCSEVAMALFLAHICMLNAYFFWRHRRVSRPLLMVLIATCLGVALVVMAPGNANRQTWYSNDVMHAPIPALLMALKLAVRQVGIWLVFLPFVLFSFVSISVWPDALRITRQRSWELIVVAVVLMAGSVFGGFFLGTWSMGAVIPQRAVNLALLFFIIDWAIFLTGFIGLLRSLNVWLPKPGLWLAVGAVVVFLASAAVVKNNVTRAWRDLLSGQAARYDQECTERHALIRASTVPDVVVPALSAHPATIFFNDLHADRTNWRNTGCARFFRKHSIALKP
jgi:Family of unknown function (DUF6056)